jgi:hypothetical protein
MIVKDNDNDTNQRGSVVDSVKNNYMWKKGGLPDLPMSNQTRAHSPIP